MCCLKKYVLINVSLANPAPQNFLETHNVQGRSQGGAQGARAPPLSCRAMTSYERRLATLL